MQILTKTEVWVNGKYLFTADKIELKKGEKQKGPTKSIDSSNTGTVINLIKNEISPDEQKKQQEEYGERDYDTFFKNMVKRVNDPEFHIPVK